MGMDKRKCSSGYTGCVACGAGPHQPCNWDWDNGCRKGENSIWKNYETPKKSLVTWLTGEISIPRWAVMVCIVLSIIIYNLHIFSRLFGVYYE